MSLPLLLAATLASPQTVVVEQTYLKAAPGQTEQLRRFVEANWFALDALAVKEGIFTGYRLLGPTEPSPDWDFLVAVGYPQASGFDDPATQRKWAAIKLGRKDIPIDGKTLKDLGRIVRTERLRVVAGEGSN